MLQLDQLTYDSTSRSFVGELSQVAPAGFIPVQLTVHVNREVHTFYKKELVREGGELLSVVYAQPGTAVTVTLFND